MINASDEYDIRESFASLDDDKLGLLELDALYILYLGLGYQYMDKEELKKELEEQVFPSDGPQHATVEQVLIFLANKTRDREAEMNACFASVDTDSKGFITPADIVKLSETVNREAVSVEYAETMLELSQSQNRTPGRLYQYDFENLFSPPLS